MNIEYYSKSDVLTEEIKEYIEEKLVRIDSHVPRHVTNARIRVEEDTSMNSGNKFSCEITIHVPNNEFRATAIGQTAHESIDFSLHKIKRQAEKYKSQMLKNNR